MANTERQVVKLLAEEIARAINKKSGGNAATASSALSAKKLTGTISASQIAGSMSAAQISGLNNAIKGVLMALPSDGKAEEGSDDYEIIAVISNLARLEVESFTADTAEIEKLYATFGDFIKLVADEAEFSEIKSDLANIGLASIGDAKIDWAQIEINDSKLTLGDEAIYGNVTIANLSVSDANIVDLYVSKLRIKDNNGKWVAITIDEEGNPTAEEDKIVGVDGQVLADGTVDGGTKIIENSITATRLDAKDIFANRAVINELIASDMRTSVLKASEGEIAELSATTIANRVNSNEANAVQTAIMNLSDNRIAFTVGSDKPVKDEEGNPVTDAEGNSVTKFTLTDKMIEAVANVFKVKANEIDLSANDTVSISASQIKKDYHIGSSEPSDPKDGMLWYDTDPNSDCWYKWDKASGAWVDADSGFVQDMFGDNAAYIASAKIDLDGKTGTIAMMSQKVSANENGLAHVQETISQITPDGFLQSVVDNGKFSEEVQTASSVVWTIGEDGEGKTQVAFTDKAINAISDKIKITADNIEITAAQVQAVIGDVDLDVDKLQAAMGKIDLTAEQVNAVMGQVDLNAEKLAAAFKQIDVESDVFNFIADNINISGDKINLDVNESFQILVKKVEEQDISGSTIFRQNTIPSSAIAKANDLWICTGDVDTYIAGQTYQAVDAGDAGVEFAVDENGDLTYITYSGSAISSEDFVIDDNGDLILYRDDIALRINENGNVEEGLVWVLVQDKQLLDKINENAEKLAAVETDTKEYVDAVMDGLAEQIDNKAETWFYEYDPTLQNEPAVSWVSDAVKLAHSGDLFYNTKDNQAWRWFCSKDEETGSFSYGWVEIKDADSLNALDRISETEAALDGKMTVFTDDPSKDEYPDPPYQVGDLWVQGADGDILVCVNAKTSDEIFDANDWKKASKYVSEEEVKTFAAEAIEGFQEQIDGKVETFFDDCAPDNSSLVSEWTDEEKQKHIGDLYYDTKNKHSYRYTSTGWVIIEDADTQDALKKATDAKDTADGKRTTFVSQPYPPYQVGDLWHRSASESMYICLVGREKGEFQSSDWDIAGADEIARADSEAAKINAELAKIYDSDTPPTTEPIDGKIWLDTGVSPAVFRKWVSGKWDTDYSDRYSEGWFVINDSDELKAAQNLLQSQLDQEKARINALETLVRVDSDGLHVGKSGETSELVAKYDSLNIVVGSVTASTFASNYLQFLGDGGMRMFKPSSGGMAFIPAPK